MPKYYLSRLWFALSLVVLGVFVADVIRKSPSSFSEVCNPDDTRNQGESLSDYVTSDSDGFAQIEDNQIVINNANFAVYGVNYYPSQYPWRRFLVETDPQTLEFELMLLAGTGFNTLRIFLWNDVLFACHSAVPNVENFERLDDMMHIMADYGFRLIVTLNDMPDLSAYPLYDNYEFVQSQTAFIVNRYRDEPAILAWDLRNEGDIDYGSRELGYGRFQREDVLNWLANTSALVRSIDNNHLITAGWMDDAHATAPYVDFISFHHWWDGVDLQRRIDLIQRYTDLPILLEEFGYNTFDLTLERQEQNIREILEITQRETLLGWMIWTAFDFPLDRTCLPSPCLSVDSGEHHFGVWTSDYTPKPAINTIREFIQ